MRGAAPNPRYRARRIITAPVGRLHLFNTDYFKESDTPANRTELSLSVLNPGIDVPGSPKLLCELRELCVRFLRRASLAIRGGFQQLIGQGGVSRRSPRRKRPLNRLVKSNVQFAILYIYPIFSLHPQNLPLFRKFLVELYEKSKCFGYNSSHET